MPENKSSQAFEIRNGIIAEEGSLVSLVTLDANSNIGLLYHIDIVSSIPDRQAQSIAGALVLDKSHDLRLSMWRTPIHNDRIHALKDCMQHLLQNLIAKDDCQRGTIKHQNI